MRTAPVEPAASIIRLFGGAKIVGKIVNKHASRVYRWTYPESVREGGGGIIPARDQRLLLAYAEQHGIDLRPGDFFDASRLIARFEAESAESAA
jgi:hypothetical protein